MIDAASDHTVGEPIGLGANPSGIAITPDGKRAYFVGGGAPGSVAAIDTADNETVGEPTAVGSGPIGIAIVPDQPPIAALASGTGTVGQPVRLDASASHDADGRIARYDWSFGDGESALDAGPTPTHAYDAPGAYRVTVTLTDSEGCSTGFVFTGVTASCNGSPTATATSSVHVAAAAPIIAPPQVAPPTPPLTLPSDAFHLGRVHRNRRRGIARLAVRVPGPGVLLLRGGRVRRVRRTARMAGTLHLAVRPKRRLTEALKHRARLRVRVRISFRPDGGVARTLTRGITLVRRTDRH